jgi:hypothetical protein
VALVLDTGGLIAFQRGDRRVTALLEAARRRRDRVVTSSGCVAQAWRGGPRQALLARLVRGLDERGLDGSNSTAAGVACGKATVTDVVDAHVSLLATDRDVVLTSDPGDIQRLLSARGCAAAVKRC